MAGNKNSGRLPKSDEQQMIERLSVLTEDVVLVLKKNILEGKSWAIRIWFNRVFGKPKEFKETNLKLSNVSDVGNVIKWVKSEDVNIKN